MASWLTSLLALFKVHCLPAPLPIIPLSSAKPPDGFHLYPVPSEPRQVTNNPISRASPPLSQTPSTCCSAGPSLPRIPPRLPPFSFSAQISTLRGLCGLSHLRRRCSLLARSFTYHLGLTQAPPAMPGSRRAGNDAPRTPGALEKAPHSRGQFAHQPAGRRAQGVRVWAAG